MAIDCINIGDGFNNIVLSSLIQPDGKIVTGGLYTQYDGVSENYAVRLNSNGFKDTSFNIGSGFNDWVRTVHYQPDTKIVIGGEFTAFTGTAQSRLIRLNSDGSKDTSFNIETGFNSTLGFGVLSVAQYGTSLYVGGGFTTFTGQTNNKLIRLNSDGSKDTSFNIGTGFNTGNSVNSIYVQSDNKVLVGGDFITFTGSTQRGLIRLNTDGSKDTSFDIGTGFSMSTIVSRNINSIAQQTDNKLLIGGFFTQYSGIPQGYLIRLNLNGTKDTSFDIGIGFNSSVRSVVIQPDGKILVGGDFSTFNTVPENGLIRLNTGGTKDNSFYLGAGFNNGADIYSINLQVDGSLIVTGNFTSYDGVPANRIVKLSSDGELLNCLPIEPTPTPTETPTQTPTNTQTPSVTPTNTNTPSVTPTNTQTPTNTPTNTQTPSPTPTKTTTPTQTPTNTKTPTQTPSGTPIACGLGITKGQYYYLDCCKNFVSGNQDGLEVSFDYTQPFGGIVKLNTRTTAICPSPTPTPTKTVTPTNTATPTNTPTKTVTPTVSKTPPVTPSNTPVTRLKNACDVITLFEMGISCNVIQSPTESNPLSGILSINVTGGTAPYSFFWEGGQRSQTLFGVPAGSYEVVVTDYNWPDGSPDYTATTICELFGPTPSPTQTMTPTPSNTPPIQCVDLCLIVIGARGVKNFGPMQFVCNGTQNGRFRWTSGTYDIVWNINNNRWEIYTAGATTPYVLDGGGIFASTTFNLIPDSAWVVLGGSDTYNSITMTKGNCPTVIPLQVNIEKTNTSCQGTRNCNGSISILAEDGIPPYLYSIDGGITYSINTNFTNLCSNDYTVVVNDSGNNSQTSTVTIDYDSAPVTYQLSLANVSPATTTSVPNVSKTVTQQMTLVSTPPLPVGVSVTFDLFSTALTTVDGPGSASSSVIWNITKNGSFVNTEVGVTTQSQQTRPFCSPNIRTITSTDYRSSITITNGDVINITSTTVDTITNGQVASQSNCTTNILTQVSSVISTPTILGNTCSSVIGSSRQVQSNEFTYVPIVVPLPLKEFIINAVGVTGITSTMTYSGFTIISSLTYYIDWGDGNIETFPPGTTSINHTYLSPYTGQIKILSTDLTTITFFASQSNPHNSQSLWTSTSELQKLGGLISLICNLTNGLFITGDVNDLPNTLDYLSTTNNNLSGNTSNLPPSLTIMSIYGSNTISGDTSGFPNTITNSLNLYGYNTVSGNVSDLPTSSTLQINGYNTISGDTSGIPMSTRFLIDGNNTISGDVSNLPSTLVRCTIQGNNTISGNISSFASLPLIQIMVIEGDNTIEGDISTLPITLIAIRIIGFNTITGDIQYLPPNLLSLTLQNKVLSPITVTVFGNVTSLPSSIERVNVASTGTFTGDLYNIPTPIINFVLNGNITFSYSSLGRTWASNFFNLTIDPSGSWVGFNSTETDNILIDIQPKYINTGSSKFIIKCSGTPKRTAASNAAFTSLQTLIGAGNVELN